MRSKNKGVSLLLSFSIILTLLVIISASVWRMEYSRVFLEEERKKSIELESLRTSERISAYHEGYGLEIVNEWNRPSKLAGLLVLYPNGSLKLIKIQEVLRPGAIRKINLNERVKEIYIITDLGNVFKAIDPSNVNSTRSLSSESIIEGSHSVIDVSGQIYPFSSKRTSFIELNNEFKLVANLNETGFVSASGYSESIYTRGVVRNYARSEVSIDGYSDKVSKGPLTGKPVKAVVSMNEAELFRVNGVEVLITGYSKSESNANKDNTYTKAKCKLEVMIRFPREASRLIIYREPELLLSSGAKIISVINGVGKSIGSGWKVFLSNSNIVKITYYIEARHSSTYARSKWLSYINLKLGFPSNTFKAMIAEFNFKKEVEVTKLNLDSGSYLLSEVNGSLHKPITIKFRDEKYFFINSCRIALLKPVNEHVYHCVSSYEEATNLLGGYELISLSELIGLTEGGERVYRILAAFSWLITPSIEGKDPYQVIVNESIDWGAIYPKPYRLDNAYVLFKVKNNLPVKLRISGEVKVNALVKKYARRVGTFRWRYIGSFNESSVAEFNSVINPRSTSQILLSNPFKIVFDADGYLWDYKYVYYVIELKPTTSEVVIEPVVEDWGDPLQVYYWFLYKSKWIFRLGMILGT